MLRRARHKLFVPAILVIVGLLVTGILSLKLSSEKRMSYVDISTRASKINYLAEEIGFENDNILFQLFQYSTNRDPKNLDSIRVSYSKVLDYLEELKILVQEERASEMIEEFQMSYQNLSGIINEIISSATENRPEVTQHIFKQFLMIHNLNRAKIRDINSLRSLYAEAEFDSFDDAHQLTLWLILSAIIACILISVSLVLYYETKLIQPLRTLSKAIRKVSSSDFSLDIPDIYREELGELNRAFNAALTEVRARIESEQLMNKKLQEANKELQHFSYITSHDLKEPIRQVRIYLELIEAEIGTQLKDDTRNHFSVVVQACSRMTSMVDGLQALFEIGNKRSQFTNVDLNQVTKDAVSNLSSFLEERKAEVFQTQLPSVIGDSAQLTELFQNLIANAIKFNRSPSPRVEIFYEEDLINPEQWIFGVSDNGIGIENAQLEKVFRIFERLHRQDEFPGSGIGLALCRKIVANHGGRIWVESKPGDGSTFYFVLPRGLDIKKTGSLG